MQAEEAARRAPLFEGVPQAPPPLKRSWYTVVTMGVVMGVMFGTGFVKSHVYEPNVIRDQFLFQRFLMLKMFLGAMGTSALCVSALALFVPTKFTTARKAWQEGQLERGVLSGTSFGALLLGVGMAVAGACPGMVLVQVGSGVPNSGLTFFGGLCGAFVYGTFEPWLSRSFFAKGPRPPSKVYADKYISYIGFSTLAGLLGVVMLAVTAVLEWHFNWKDELPERLKVTVANCTTPLNCAAWPPSVGGAFVGILQIPILLVLDTFLGSATSYQVITALWMRPLAWMYTSNEENRIEKMLPYMASFSHPGQRQWWQVPYAVTTIIISAIWASQGLSKADGIAPAAAFIGGFIMVFGSRCGDSCTSGHGISGCAVLTIQSFIAVFFMFAGGISTAFALDAATNFSADHR